MTTILETNTSLAALMREGSQAEHTAAESHGFMSTLLDGQVNEAGYAHYLSLLRPVYAALEGVAAELAHDPLVAAVVDTDLNRLEAIDADLAYWAPEGQPEVTSPATRAYVDRIHESRSWGGLFVAHHYTRYMGDLSGGQAIGRILTRSYGLSEGTGVAFYDFTAIPKPKPFKDGYRSRLDALALTEWEKQRVVDEVREAFNRNSGLFEELSAGLDHYRR